jgi:adenylate cyclase
MASKEHKVERHLAAILAADVAGYSRLMSQDEVGTLRTLTAHREIMDRLIAEHGGRIANTAGDSVLAEFPSAVDAVQCAMEVQKALGRLNEGAAPEKALRFRIGIHVGDVMVRGGDLLGDGVNIAARLEGLADPGGVCISGDAYRQVRKALPITFADLGPQQVKNIEEPIQAYCVRSPDPGSIEQTATSTMQKPIPLPDKPSIAILPFTNMSGDAGQQFFSEGITQDIATELSHFREIKVRSAGASFERKHQGLNARQVAHDLDVQYVIQGGVRRLASRIRITVQLVDAHTGDHIWSERYDRDQDEVFTIQDEVVSTIVGTLVGRLRAAGVERVRRRPTSSLAAYECVLRGDALPIGDGEAEAEARRLYEQAIELDPDYARAHALLAYALSLEWFRDMTGDDALLDRAFELARRAVFLDDSDRLCHDMLGWVYLHRESFDLAEQHKLRALALNPSSPEQVAIMGILYLFLGRADEGITWMERAKRLDPYFEPTWRCHMLGVAHFVAGRYDEAILHLSRSRTMPMWLMAYLAACHALAGRLNEAHKFVEQIRQRFPQFSLVRVTEKEPFKREEDRERLIAGMRTAGLPE